MAVSMDSESAAPLLGEDSHTRPARPRRQSWTHQVRVWLPLSVLMLFASLALSVVWLRIPSVAGFLDKNRLDDSLGMISLGDLTTAHYKLTQSSNRTLKGFPKIRRYTTGTRCVDQHAVHW